MIAAFVDTTLLALTFRLDNLGSDSLGVQVLTPVFLIFLGREPISFTIGFRRVEFEARWSSVFDESADRKGLVSVGPKNMCRNHTTGISIE